MIKRPKNVKPIPTKWVYETKIRTNGTVKRYKAILVVRGDKQILGLNNKLTFFKVMPIGNAFVIFTISRMWGFRLGMVASQARARKLSRSQSTESTYFDGIKVTQGTLERLGVMEPDELVLLLGRNRYGLNQAGRLWHQVLCDTLLKIDFVQCINDPCFFY